MDVGTPFRWWTPLALFALGLGCHGPDRSKDQIRPQMPPDVGTQPVPLGPTPPVDNGPPIRVVGPPIQGLPAFPEKPPGSVVTAAPGTAGGPLAGPLAPASLSVPAPGRPTNFNPPAAASALPKKPDIGEPLLRFVAYVGKDYSVTDAEVNEAVKRRIGSERSHPSHEYDGLTNEELARRFYPEELRRIIERELVIDEMHKRLTKAKKTHMLDQVKEDARKESEKQLRHIRASVGAKTEADFQLWLRGQGMTIPIWMRAIERDFMAQVFLSGVLREKQQTLGPTEIRDYYQNHPERFHTPDRVKWQDIFISFRAFENALGTADAAAVRSAALKHAQIIQMHAAAGEDFAALSKRYDNGLSGQNGGEGNGSERGAIQPPVLEPTIWGLKAGQVSGVIETPAGFHIVKIVSRDYAGVKPYDDKVQREARNLLFKETFEREKKLFIDELWRTNLVKYP